MINIWLGVFLFGFNLYGTLWDLGGYFLFHVLGYIVLKYFLILLLFFILLLLLGPL